MSSAGTAGDRRPHEALTGTRPRLFRPPGGLTSPTLLEEARKQQLAIVLWSVDPEDWNTRDAAQAAARILNKVQDGDIILMHDLFPSSIAAALQVIDALEAQGYQFCTVSELAFLRCSAMEPALATGISHPDAGVPFFANPCYHRAKPRGAAGSCPQNGGSHMKLAICYFSATAAPRPWPTPLPPGFWRQAPGCEVRCLHIDQVDRDHPDAVSFVDFRRRHPHRHPRLLRRRVLADEKMAGQLPLQAGRGSWPAPLPPPT